AGLYILGCANGLLGRMIYAAGLEGWTGAVVGVDANAIVLFACFAGISVMLSADKDELRFADLAVGGAFLFLVALPIFPLSWVSVTVLSLYILVFADPGSGSARRRGALIMLALTVPMLWSRLFFQFFAKPILDIDAIFVASTLGTNRIGNMVGFADGSGYMIISPACTSFANISYAFLCWASVTQWAKHPWSWIDLVWLCSAGVSVVAVNVLRIVLTGQSQWHYEVIHNQYGEMVGGTIILALTVGFSVLGARRELFARD